MRILQVIPVFSAPFGGPVAVVRSISKELAKRHDVTVYTTSALDKKRDFEDLPLGVKVDGYNVFYFPRILKSSGFNFSQTMVKMLKETIDEYDVVHLHSWRHFQDIIVHHYAKKYRIPYILQAHGSLQRIIAKRRLKWIYDVLFGYGLLWDAAKVIALSSVEAKQYKSMGVLDEKIAIIPNGIDLAEYANLPAKGCFKRKFGIPEEKRIILYLGRINKTKGIDLLIKAYAHLTKKMGVKDTVLVIAGPDDGYLGELRQLVNFLKITDSVLFTGILSEKEKTSAYVDASVVVNVEPKNVFGLVLLEAAACSTPVIVSKTNAISRVIEDGNFGFSVNCGDVTNLASMLYGILNDVGLAEKLGRNGRKYVFNHFGWDNIVKEFERVYEEAVEENA